MIVYRMFTLLLIGTLALLSPLPSNALCSSSVKSLNISALYVTSLQINNASFLNANGNAITLPTSTSTLATVASVASAIAPLATSTSVTSAIATAVAPLATSASLTSAIAPLATSTSVASTITAAVAPLATSTSVTSAIATAIAPLATSASVTSAIAPLATTTNVASSIATAIAPLATSASVTSAIAPLATTTNVASSIATAISPLATSANVTSAIATAVAPLATSTSVTSAIATAIAPLATTTNVASSIATAIAPLATSTSVTSAIATAIAPLATSTSVTSSIATAIAPLATTSSMTSAIAAAVMGLDNNVTVNALIASAINSLGTVSTTGALTVGGLTNATNGLTVAGTTRLGVSGSSSAAYTAHSTLDDSNGNMVLAGTLTVNGNGLMVNNGAGINLHRFNTSGATLYAPLNVVNGVNGGGYSVFQTLASGVITTLHSTLDDGSGNMRLTSASTTTNWNSFGLYAPSLGTNSIGMQVGVAANTVNQAAQIFFSNGSTASTSSAFYGLYGGKGINVGGTGVITTSGGNVIDDGNGFLTSVAGIFGPNFGTNGFGFPTVTANRQVIVGITSTPSFQGLIQTNVAGTIAALPLSLQASVVQTVSSTGVVRNTLDDGLGSMTIGGVSPTLTMSGTTSNYIAFANVGTGAPSFSPRSIGTKLIYNSQLSASAVDFATGISTNTLWSSVPNTASQFQWFGGTSSAMILSGTGALSTTTSTGTARTVLDDGSGNMNLITYPNSGSSSRFQIGNKADMNGNYFGLGIGLPSSAGYSPLGIFGGGGTNARKWFQVGNDASTKTKFNTLDDGTTGDATFAGTVTASGTTLTSDARLKDNIVSESWGSVDKLLNLRPVTFNFKKTPEKITHGFIAQEVQNAFPELISPFMEGDEERLSLDYVQMISILVQTVQHQHTHITEQQVLLSKQDERIERLEQGLNTLLYRENYS